MLGFYAEWITHAEDLDPEEDQSSDNGQLITP